MLRVLSIGLLFTLFVTNTSFASANNTAKTVPLFNSEPAFSSNKHPQMQLVGVEALRNRKQALIDSISFKNLLTNVEKLPVVLKNTENKGFSYLQNKYAEKLNVLPELLSNISLLEELDYWYGTRYLYGGTTKNGIDCSAFVRAMYNVVYGVGLPRTAREQYAESRRISTTELKEGDLVFFNTRGGVSHVGIYLKNNKFAHSSSGRGVVISDLFENYYMSHYIGAGRIIESDQKPANPFFAKN